MDARMKGLELMARFLTVKRFPSTSNNFIKVLKASCRLELIASTCKCDLRVSHQASNTSCDRRANSKTPGKLKRRRVCLGRLPRIPVHLLVFFTECQGPELLVWLQDRHGFRNCVGPGGQIGG